ncbi:MAG TPA: hypothetical protein VKZ87_02050 [Ferrovibrio sp.]|jgi:hypothetical protein|uniref:hypothetical protein n=1 Tax=Ferrovibrio sp. TaxID=1917215 RepID=UPI002B4AD140|nr:hypothetical protein [Ferrovibrio sp.]HLT76144.1 hypothetical protein [Ferrovibrio sp.]
MGIPGGGEISAALRGLAFVLRGDPRALHCYDLTADGFWRSFVLPLVAMALYFLLQQPTEMELAGWEGNEIGFGLVLAGQYLSTWIAYLACVLLLVRGFQLQGSYPAFVILYNWAQGITLAATLPVLAASQWDLLPPGALEGWHFALLVVWLYIVAQIARLALGAGLAAAMAAASLDLAVTILLHRLFSLLG